MELNAFISMTLRGVSQVDRNIKQAIKDKVKEGAGALYELSQEVIAQSQKLVPVDTSALKNSAFVKMPVIKGENARVLMGYGGQAEDYAIVQHEDLSLNHPNGGQAKFLEIPLLQMRQDFPAKLAARIKARTR